MKNQKELIHKREWDTLIILDACRYDYFASTYTNYLEGKLSKVRSAGYSTSTWYENTFLNSSFENTVYISGNPHINSKNIGFENLNVDDLFHKVIDVWESGWDEDLQTVPPKAIGKEARKAKMNLPDKRLICHFCQPHGPYISIGPMKNIKEDNLKEEVQNRKPRDSRGKIGNFLEKILGKLIFHKMRAKIGLPIAGTSARVAEKYGEKRLKEAYRNNLETALLEVAEIVERFPSGNKIIVTADHGELLGEDGLYGHGYPHPLLITVPWVEINRK